MIKGLIIAMILLTAGYYAAMPLLPWDKRRKLRHTAAVLLASTGAIVALIPLVLLVGYLVKAGWPGLNAAFFTQTQKPLGEPGSGLLHAITGSLIIVGIASIIGIPIGVLSGVWLSEFGRGRIASLIRFIADVLTGLPSIIAGILGYELIVAHTKSFSGLAGGVALSILMIPVITRVTEESLKLVPQGLREASFGLGIGSARTVWNIVLPAAKSGIMTGVILAVARVGGETAPLLFTAAGQSQFKTNPMEAMAALPLSIYLNSGQPFDVSQQLAISGALFLVIVIGLVNIGTRWLAGRNKFA